MRGGRSFASRGGRPGDRDYGGKFRGNSYRDGPSGGGRFNNQNRGNDRRFDDSFGKSGSSSRSRSRYDRRSPDRFAHGNLDRSNRNDPRDDPILKKRPRIESNSGRRRDFSSNLSDNNRHSRHHSNGDNGRNINNRNNRRSPPKSSPSSRHANVEIGSSHHVKERTLVNKANRRFSGKGVSVRDKVETNARIRRSKLMTSVRSTILRRSLVNNRKRDAARRAKLMRSSLMKRNTAVKKNIVEEDDGERTSKSKTEETDSKSDVDKESDKKKSTKKPSDDNENENDENQVEETIDDSKLNAPNEADKLPITKASDNEDDKESVKKEDEKEKRKKFVRLFCPHCRIESATFKDYNNHIHSRSHKLLLGRYGLKQKSRLARMRLAQRNAQRQLEKELKDAEKLTPQFCMLCRLNYRSPKEEHQASEAHRTMKEFLMPHCEICSSSFKSPMSYEIHRCSVEHLRKKANKGDERDESDVEESEELQVDLENFLIVDSVGDVNGGEFSFNDESDENPIDVKSSDVTSRAEINVGNEHVKKVEVLYCELCRYYLPHLDDSEAALQKHCSTRNHLRAYLRYKENQSLKITAEMIHRRDHKEKHSKKDSKSMESDGKHSSSVAKTDDDITDKIWEDAEKDCDQIEQSNLKNNNEDEDDTSVERFDRFKNSEKSDEAEVSENDADTDIDNTKGEPINQHGTESSI
ncbi:zinc finger protein on ecdysone puffs-like isoform X2 [Contarinia nasturtii]|uniref:zinc finger protein on ecdysone puffs-like isoform X2 n=1 Tax=Contarinia nasturtii TaxID=265458 RepID=UPI0012D4AF18|nr:zinc finger protein on ecdysone puffs-like isoform X2 [Contarinia nasturtii]